MIPKPPDCQKLACTVFAIKAWVHAEPNNQSRSNWEYIKKVFSAMFPQFPLYFVGWQEKRGENQRPSWLSAFYSIFTIIMVVLLDYRHNNCQACLRRPNQPVGGSAAEPDQPSLHVWQHKGEYWERPIDQLTNWVIELRPTFCHVWQHKGDYWVRDAIRTKKMIKVGNSPQCREHL